jgi:hypothetical protein
VSDVASAYLRIDAGGVITVVVDDVETGSLGLALSDHRLRVHVGTDTIDFSRVGGITLNRVRPPGLGELSATVDVVVNGDDAFFNTARLLEDARVSRGPCNDACRPVLDEEFNGGTNSSFAFNQDEETAVQFGAGRLDIAFSGNRPGRNAGFLWTPPPGVSLRNKVVTLSVPLAPTDFGTQLIFGVNTPQTTDFVGPTVQFDRTRYNGGSGSPDHANVLRNVVGPLWLRLRYKADGVDLELSDDGLSFARLLGVNGLPPGLDERLLYLNANQFTDVAAAELSIDSVIAVDAACVPPP